MTKKNTVKELKNILLQKDLNCEEDCIFKDTYGKYWLLRHKNADMKICPICFQTLNIHVINQHMLSHGYDNLQADILLDFDVKYKGLIENVELKIPPFDLYDKRYICFERFLKETYKFCMPSESDYSTLKLKKKILALVETYKDIIGCQIYALKIKIEKEQVIVQRLDLYKLNVLNDLFKEVKLHLILLKNKDEVNQEYLSSNVFIEANYLAFSWDNIDFLEKAVVVKLPEFERNYRFSIPSSQLLLNRIKEIYFKKRHPYTQFNIRFLEKDKIDIKRSSILGLEDFLKANYENIEYIFKNLDINKQKQTVEAIKADLQSFRVDKEKIIQDKHEYIKLALSFVINEDRIYSIKENNNGVEEGMIIIEFSRTYHNYILVENENPDRSAHMFAFKKQTENYVEKIHGFFFSEKKNKRMLLKERKINFKKEFETAFDHKVLYHKGMKTYKDYLELCLYRLI